MPLSSNEAYDEWAMILYIDSNNYYCSYARHTPLVVFLPAQSTDIE